MESPSNPQYSLDNILNYQDIESSVDGFTQHLFSEFANGFPQKIIEDNTNEDTIIKRIREYYLSKGTKKSYEFLFRILFKKTPVLYYPKIDILKTSASAWDLYQYMFVHTTGHLENTLIGEKFVGDISGESAYIQSLVLQTYQYNGENVYKIYISNPSSLDFIPGEELIVNGIAIAMVENSITNIDVSDPGRNYNHNQSITVSGVGDGADIRLCECSVGTVERIIILSGGYGYQPGDKLKISSPTSSGKPADGFIGSVDLSGMITSIQLTSGGYGYEELPDIEIDSNSSGTGGSLLAYSDDIGIIKKIKIINAGIGYDNSTILSFFDGNASAELAAISSTIGSEYKYTTTDSHLDSNKMIQDSLYWQDFSYEITVELEISKYRDFVKELIHPVGLKMFGSFLVVLDENERVLDGNITAAQTLDILRKTFITDAGIQSIEDYIELAFRSISYVEEYEVNLGPTYSSLERLKFKFRPEEMFQRRVTSRNRSRVLKIPYNYYSPEESDSNQDVVNNRADTTLENHINPETGMIPTNNCMLYDVINYPGIQTSIAPDSETLINRRYRYSLKKNNVSLVDDGYLRI